MAWWRRSGGHADANQKPLVDFARRLGATVRITTHMGKDFPDAILGFREVNLLWEFKRRGEVGKRGKRKKGGQLSQGQERFRDTWMGRVELIQTTDDALRSLLMADHNRPMDAGSVPDDFLAAIVRTIRGRLPELRMSAPKGEYTAMRPNPEDGPDELERLKQGRPGDTFWIGFTQQADCSESYRLLSRPRLRNGKILVELRRARDELSLWLVLKA